MAVDAQGIVMNAHSDGLKQKGRVRSNEVNQSERLGICRC